MISRCVKITTRLHSRMWRTTVTGDARVARGSANDKQRKVYKNNTDLRIEDFDLSAAAALSPDERYTGRAGVDDA